MKKIFISQPMRGKTDIEIKLVREKAIKDVKEYLAKEGEEVEIINSYDPNCSANENPIVCLGKAITLLADADFLFLCDGWHEARGCRVERVCACEYDIPVIYEIDSETFQITYEDKEEEDGK